MNLSMIDIVQMIIAGLLLAAILCFHIVRVRSPKNDYKENRLWIQMRTTWMLIFLLVIDLGWLGGRWLADSQKPFRFITPVENQIVGARLLVTGWVKEIPDGQQLWIIVTPKQSADYYPQSQAAFVQPGGDWSSLTFIGTDVDGGKSFDILAVLVNSEARASIIEYLNSGNQNGMQVLPPGAKVLDNVSVTRK